jgi:GTP cyclohydrolase II
MHQADRGLFDLQRGRPLHVTTSGEPAALLATVEGLTSQILDQLRELNEGCIRLALTTHRARAMGLTNGGPPCDISLGLNGTATADQILRLSSVAARYNAESIDVREASAAEAGGVALARLGRLLPAVVSIPVSRENESRLRTMLDSGTILTVTTDQIKAMEGNGLAEVIYVSDGPVPLEDAEDARFVCFREANGILEHVAILIGDRGGWPDPVPVRIHSACLTGDLFGSLRCDCGEQLRRSLRVFTASGGGVLLYLAQEGRGIGLANKLRAYALQQEGLDTVDADCTLGFGADERRYDAAVQMLRELGIQRIQLLTNNPDKVRAVEEAGIEVLERQPVYGTLNRHNLNYVKAKVNRAGHWLGEMLSGTASGE